MKTNNPPKETRENFFLRSWQLLIEPHPSITDVGERRRAQLLSALSLILAVSLTWGILSQPSAFTIFLVFIGITVSAYITSRTRFYRFGAYLFSFGFTSIAFINIYSGDANSIDSSVMSIVPISLILASALLSQVEFLILAVTTVIATASLGSWAPSIYIDDPDFALVRLIGITFSVGVLLFGISAFRASVEHNRLKEVQQINAELQELTANLENRVTERTKALVTSAEVSRRLSTLLDPRQLINEVVNEVRSAFEFYYAQIYLLDKTGENLVLEAGTGETGAALIARGHSLPVGSGLVGRTATSKEPVLVSDTYQDPDWLPNELLPETKAEAAVPISVGDEVLGVLDVQHDLVNGLTAEDVTLLESLAGQVAITLQNARSYEESRKQAELEALVNVIGQRIQRTTTMEDTLQTAIRELGTAIGASRVQARIKMATDGNEVASVLPSEQLIAVPEHEEQPISDNPNSLVA